jgi:hypothetical protein
MTVRAKMKCYAVQPLQSGDPNETMVEIRMIPDYSSDDPENKTWSKYTPCGEVRLFVTNPDAIKHFDPGKFYYIDFTPAE